MATSSSNKKPSKPPTPNYEALYRQALEATQPKPNPSLGKTSPEWASVWNKGPSATRVSILRFVEAGLMEQDTDWRPVGTGFRRTPVFRFTPKLKDAR